mmetsp:Transcript_8740/g.12127  ORF Transcript_8740/g.12127 Transcript_8740/m.12127 type:complete len:507 (+) Transcript_8740:26-1546(+)
MTSSVVDQVLRLALFDHLPRKQHPRNPDSIEGDRGAVGLGSDRTIQLHPATLKLGALYNKGLIQADDDRVAALISLFHNLVNDYKTPPNKILREDLDKYISKQIQFIVESRQLSKGMGNLIKFLRLCISKISPESSEADAKAFLLEKLHSFLEDRIIFAAESIAKYVISAIRDDDVVLTFGSSPLIRKVLHAVVKANKRFRLIVIDARPLNDGLETLSSLSHYIHCVYCPLSGAAAVMKDATKVLLGASCLLSNGSMLAPAGTAMVAALAKARQVPVLVAAESYKFSDKVQLDSIVFNELGNGAEIVSMQPPSAAAMNIVGAAYGATGSGGSGVSNTASGGDGVEGSGGNKGERGGSGGEKGDRGAAGGAQSKASADPSSSASSASSAPVDNNPQGWIPTPTLQPYYRGPAETLLLTDNSNSGGGSGCEHIALPLASYVNSNSSRTIGSATGVSGSAVRLPFDVINLRYDLTPIGNISAVATEAGLIPPTSIPVFIRELVSEMGNK